jgi:hypothetical protein
MQQYACVANSVGQTVYQPLDGFTAADLGYQKGDAVSNFVTKFDEPANTEAFLNLFEQVWNDPERVADVTDALSEHIAPVCQENSPERIYFLMLFNSSSKTSAKTCCPTT